MILLSVLMMYQVSAQGKRIKYNKVGRNSKTIEFKNENGTILKTLDVLGNSPYFEGFVSKKIGNLKERVTTANERTDAMVSDVVTSGVAITYSYTPYDNEMNLIEELSEATIEVFNHRWFNSPMLASETTLFT